VRVGEVSFAFWPSRFCCGVEGGNLMFVIFAQMCRELGIVPCIKKRISEV
jgi:hypothetical protein